MLFRFARSVGYLSLLIAVSVTVSMPAAAQDWFDKGAKRLSVVVGAGSAFDDDYFILGIGGGYYLTNGLELGLNWQTWLGGDPSINQLTPELTYVIKTQSAIHPYIGALYRHTFISGLDDLSAYGGRAGINITTNPRTYFGIGAVYQRYIDCDESTYRDCSSSYPEFVFGFSF
jgi:hypothetical protein